MSAPSWLPWRPPAGVPKWRRRSRAGPPLSPPPGKEGWQTGGLRRQRLQRGLVLRKEPLRAGAGRGAPLTPPGSDPGGATSKCRWPGLVWAGNARLRQGRLPKRAFPGMGDSASGRGASECGRIRLPGLSRTCGMVLWVRNQRKVENKNLSKW